MMFRLTSTMVALLLSAFIVGCCWLQQVTSFPVLNQEVMTRAEVAVEMAALVQEDFPDPTGYGFSTFKFYDFSPDKIITATKNNICYASFTTGRIGEVASRNPVHICGVHGCCDTFDSVWLAYSKYQVEFETNMRDCAASCADPNNCIVLSGHGEGASKAILAALGLGDLTPTIYLFGAPRTVDLPCPVISSSRLYNFINTLPVGRLGLGIFYDKYPTPGFLNFSSILYNIGEVMLLTNDTSAAYLGQDYQFDMGPVDATGVAHRMDNYVQRIKDLNAANTYPVRSDGFNLGKLCTEAIECQSDFCTRKRPSLVYKRCNNQF